MSRPLVLHVFKCIYAGTLHLSGVPLSHAEELVYYVGQDSQVLTTGPAYMRYSGTLRISLCRYERMCELDLSLQLHVLPRPSLPDSNSPYSAKGACERLGWARRGVVRSYLINNNAATSHAEDKPWNVC